MCAKDKNLLHDKAVHENQFTEIYSICKTFGFGPYSCSQKTENQFWKIEVVRRKQSNKANSWNDNVLPLQVISSLLNC
jgi:hypothetical protein